MKEKGSDKRGTASGEIKRCEDVGRGSARKVNFDGWGQIKEGDCVYGKRERE